MKSFIKAMVAALVVVYLICPMIDAEASNEEYYLAEAIYYEARGESEAGQAAVAMVILNRVDKNSWPDTIQGVIYQRRQFSYTFDGSKKTPIMTSSRKWMLAKKVARNAMLSQDFTGGADHYQNTATATDGGWKNSMELLFVIGNHSFYKSKMR